MHSPCSAPQSAFLMPSVIHSGIAGSPSIGADAGRDVQAVALLPRRLVFDQLAVAQPWVIGPVLVAPRRAVGTQQRHQQTGDTAAGGLDDLQLGEPPFVGDRFVTAGLACSGGMPDAASISRWSATDHCRSACRPTVLRRALFGPAAIGRAWLVGLAIPDLWFVGLVLGVAPGSSLSGGPARSAGLTAYACPSASGWPRCGCDPIAAVTAHAAPPCCVERLDELGDRGSGTNRLRPIWHRPQLPDPMSSKTMLRPMPRRVWTCSMELRRATSAASASVI